MEVTRTKKTGNNAAVAPDDREREAARAREKMRRYRKRLLREAWRGRVLIAHPFPGECPYHETTRCRGCRRGAPCKFERSVWDAAHREALNSGMSEGAASLLATLQMRLVRRIARGDEKGTDQQVQVLLRTVLEHERHAQRMVLEDRKLEIMSAGTRKPTNTEIITAAVRTAREAKLEPQNGNGGEANGS